MHLPIIGGKKFRLAEEAGNSIHVYISVRAKAYYIKSDI